MYKIYNYMHNFVKIKITGYKPQKLINICLRRRIKIWELTQINENEFTLCMSVKDFKRNIKSAARKSGVKVKILSKKGLVFKIKKYKNRKLLLCIFGILCLLFIYLSSAVWEIKVVGADADSRQQIINLIDDMGIKKGSLITQINAKELAEHLLMKQDELSWVGVKKKGTTLKIEIIQAAFYEEKTGDDIPSDEPCDIAVSKDCLLYKVTVEEGEQIVKTGNTAMAGQTIITGNGKHAKARVWGCVWYKTKVPVEMVVEEMIYTGKQQKENSFLLFGLKIEAPEWRWLPWNWNKEKYRECDVIYYEKYLGGKKKLPIGLGTEIKKETMFQEKTLSEKEAELYAISKAQGIIDAVIPKEGRILSTNGNFEISPEGTKYYILTAEVLENVGIAVYP